MQMPTLAMMCGITEYPCARETQIKENLLLDPWQVLPTLMNIATVLLITVNLAVKELDLHFDKHHIKIF